MYSRHLRLAASRSSRFVVTPCTPRHPFTAALNNILHNSRKKEKERGREEEGDRTEKLRELAPLFDALVAFYLTHRSFLYVISLPF